MTTPFRKTGNEVLGDVPWGTHLCCFYETKEDLLDIVVPYFKTGLTNQEFCLWVISNSERLTEQEAMSALRKALPDVDQHVVEKSLEVVGHDEWFLDGGTFDPHRVADRFKEKLAEALARGCAGMRCNGSPAWLRGEGARVLHEFEMELSNVFRDERILALCTYPLAAIGGEEIFDVVRTHEFAVARRHGTWEIIETPELERRVIARTHALRAANEELEKEIRERRRAEEDLTRTSDQLRALSARVQSAREEEGTRIAREIHDDLGSLLTSLKWDLEGMSELLSGRRIRPNPAALKKKADAMTRTVDGMCDAVRRIAAELRPSVLDDLGLVAAIEWQARQFQARTGIVCRCECALDDGDLTQEQSTAVFRVLQETLTNVLRHAQATRVDITAAKEADAVIVTIRDNGRGIRESEKSGPQSLGLLGMRERARLIGAELEVGGIEGRGTAVRLRVPRCAGRRSLRSHGHEVGA